MTPAAAVESLVRAMNEPVIQAAGIIEWACPVPYFGHMTEAQIATVGINPSNKEFVGNDGAPLTGKDCRLPTLSTLGLADWPDADHRAFDAIVAGCSQYFEKNPYEQWFDTLERLLLPCGASYYAGTLATAVACHLDIVPFATRDKWGLLSKAQRGALLAVGLEATARLLRDSPVEVLVINGRGVVNVLAPYVDDLTPAGRDAWDLPRDSSRPVPGVAFLGTTSQLSGIELDRTVRLIGWNHNLQSSYGVTKPVRQEIARWLATQLESS